jgi:hypothetical protein
MTLKCDFQTGPYTKGSLGGPWVMRFDNELGYLHSITTTIGLTGILFDNNVKNLYNDVRVRY